MTEHNRTRIKPGAVRGQDRHDHSNVRLRYSRREQSANNMPGWLKPRGLSHGQAASYTGLAIATFDLYRRRGLLPAPTLPGKRYDLLLLDQAMDKLSGIGAEGEPPTPLQQWRASRGAR